MFPGKIHTSSLGDVFSGLRSCLCGSGTTLKVPRLSVKILIYLMLWIFFIES